MKRICVGMQLIGALALSSHAAPLERKDVADSPSLLAHVDIDALRSTAVGKAILADPDAQTKLAAVEAMFNFDLRTQLHGFTFYSPVDHPEDGVMIVYADFDPGRLVTLARAFNGFQAETNDTRVIYNWEKEKGRGGSHEIYAAINGHRVIFSKSNSNVNAALDVIDGKSPSLTGSKLLLAPESGELVVAEGAGTKFNPHSNDEHAAIFQASKSVRAQIGEVGDNVTAKLRFDAKDEDSANQITAMVNGLLAFAHFQKDNPDLLKLANAFSVRQDDDAVFLTGKVASADVIAALKKGVEEAREKHESHASDTNAPDNK